MVNNLAYYRRRKKSLNETSVFCSLNVTQKKSFADSVELMNPSDLSIFSLYCLLTDPSPTACSTRQYSQEPHLPQTLLKPNLECITPFAQISASNLTISFHQCHHHLLISPFPIQSTLPSPFYHPYHLLHCGTTVSILIL